MSNTHHGCCSNRSKTTAIQSLDEMDFERGLWGAALNGNVDRMEMLLRKHSVNSRDDSGYTALHYAARNGHIAICRMLLSHGAYVNATTTSSEATPLHRACYAGYNDIVHLLLSNGADASMRDADGMTALHKAAERDNTTVLRSLQEHLGKDRWLEECNISDNRGRTPLSLCPTLI